MKKFFLPFLIALVAGCMTPPPPPPFYAPPTITNTIPSPPGVPKQTVIVKKKTIKAMSVPTVPDKWIVVKWDPSMETNITYRVKWRHIDEPNGRPVPLEQAEGSFDLTQTKVDLVSLLRDVGTSAGWYQITLSCVNRLFIPSDEVPACYLVWCP